MRVFVTGASGFIGSSVVPELVRAGHQVTGLARSDASAAALAARGAAVQRGTLEDLDSLRAGASQADGVIHLAFIHDFSLFEAAARTDQLAIEALCQALEGRDAPLVMASGVLGLAPGRVVTERDDRAANGFGSPRQAGVATALSFASRGVRPSVMRLPPSVHGTGDHGFMAAIVDVARKAGFSGYVGDGAARWPAVHVKDAARATRGVGCTHYVVDSRETARRSSPPLRAPRPPCLDAHTIRLTGRAQSSTPAPQSGGGCLQRGDDRCLRRVRRDVRTARAPSAHTRKRAGQRRTAPSPHPCQRASDHPKAHQTAQPPRYR